MAKPPKEETWWCPNGCGKSFTGVPGEWQAMAQAHMKYECPKRK